MSENHRAWVALNLLPALPRTRWRLAQACGGPLQLFRSDRERLRGIAGIRPETVDKIVDLDWISSAEREIEKAKNKKIHIITPDSNIYPGWLKDLEDPPSALYLRGELRPEDRLSVAVVGARDASGYGLSTARRLGRELAGRGVAVASGLALGADAAAHRGALEAGGRTLAVLGCGADRAYPRSHEVLQEKIAASGAVISELPLGTGAARWTFPSRNRILAALTLGTLVVEAAARSGSLITAEFAADLGRCVLAVPGPVDSRRSQGTNALIHDGAGLVREARDVIDALPDEWRSRAAPGPAPVDVSSLGLEGPEARVLSRLDDREPIHVDVLARQSGLEMGSLLDVLLTLELRQLARPVPGGRYLRAVELTRGAARNGLFSAN